MSCSGLRRRSYEVRELHSTLGKFDREPEREQPACDKQEALVSPVRRYAAVAASPVPQVSVHPYRVFKNLSLHRRHTK
jgi:hypothetical protein